MVKNLPTMQETWVLSSGREDPLEEGTATHSNILAWRIPMDRGVWWATLHGVAKCQTLCVPMDCSLPGSSVHGDSPGKNIGVNCHALLQGIFSIQGSNPTLPHCSWILYCLNYQRSPRKLEWVAYPFFLGIISIQELNRSLLHCRQILYQLSYQGSLISLICGI